MDGATASGTVEADDRAQLVARASGTIRAAGLYDGQPVRRGQILATIDARQAEAAVRRARAGLDAALAEQHDARGDVARDAPLAQRSDEHTSELQSHMRIPYAVLRLK